MHEPRGHGAMSGAILQPPIAARRRLGRRLHRGLRLPADVRARDDRRRHRPRRDRHGRGHRARDGRAPRRPRRAGRGARAVTDGRATAVTIRNVESFFVGAYDGYDLAFGGNFYAIADAAEHGLTVAPEHARQLIAAGLELMATVPEPVHPDDPDIRGCQHVIWIGEDRSAVAIHPGWVDRSPCGTGTSARMAQLHARGELALDEPFVHRSIIGTRFTGRLVDETDGASSPRSPAAPGSPAWASTCSTPTTRSPPDSACSRRRRGDLRGGVRAGAARRRRRRAAARPRRGLRRDDRPRRGQRPDRRQVRRPRRRARPGPGVWHELAERFPGRGQAAREGLAGALRGDGAAASGAPGTGRDASSWTTRARSSPRCGPGRRPRSRRRRPAGRPAGDRPRDGRRGAASAPAQGRAGRGRRRGARRRRADRRRRRRARRRAVVRRARARARRAPAQGPARRARAGARPGPPQADRGALPGAAGVGHRGGAQRRGLRRLQPRDAGFDATPTPHARPARPRGALVAGARRLPRHAHVGRLPARPAGGPVRRPPATGVWACTGHEGAGVGAGPAGRARRLGSGHVDARRSARARTRDPRAVGDGPVAERLHRPGQRRAQAASARTRRAAAPRRARGGRSARRAPSCAASG